MALNNIRNEPGRELTESILGIMVIVGAIVLDYLFSSSVAAHFQHQEYTCSRTPAGCSGVWMIILPCGVVLSVGILIVLNHVSHSFGELIAARLADMGLDPRPKIRNVKWWWSPDPRIAQKTQLQAERAIIENRTDLSKVNKEYYLRNLDIQLRNLGI